MSDILERLAQALGLDLPAYGMAGVLLLLLYAIQAEIRFGARARTHSAGAADRGSTIAVSLSSIVPIFGFVAAMLRSRPGYAGPLPGWLGAAGAFPGMPAVAWVGAGLGLVGIALRMWALLTLRERYTRTLLVHENHTVERSGPFRFVRHPGYLGSLLCLNGIALTSGNLFVFLGSIIATSAAYAYRIRVEDAMLVAAFGEAYESYRREVGALIPFVR